MKKTMKYFYLIAIFLIASILASAQNPFPRGLETVFIDPIGRTNVELDAMLNIPIGRRAYSSDDQQWKTWNGTTWEQSSASPTSIHTFTVEEKSGDFITEVSDGSIKIYHSGTGIGDVIFNAEYTDYLEGLNPLIGSQPLQLIIYNITKNKVLTGEIQSLNYRTGGDGSTYFGANMVSDSMTAADIDEGDVVEVQVCVSSAGGDFVPFDGTQSIKVSTTEGGYEWTEIFGNKIRVRNFFTTEHYTDYSEGSIKFNGLNSQINLDGNWLSNQGTSYLKLPYYDGILTTEDYVDSAIAGLPSNNIYTADGIIPDATNRFVDFGSGSAFSIRNSDFKNYLYLDDNEVDIRNGYGTLRFRTGTGGTYDSNSIGDVWTATDAFGNGKWLPLGVGDVTKVGTPANNQLAVWTGDGTLEGASNLTFSNGLLRLNAGSKGLVQIEEDDIVLQKGAGGNPSIKGGTGQYKTALVFDSSGMTNNAEITIKNESGVNALISDIDTAINSITPTSLLTDIKTVDGEGSGLDADTLDGLDSTSFLPATLEVAEIDPASKFTDVKLALFDTQAELDAASLSTNTIAWSKDGGDPIDSTDITYDNTVSGLTASNVKSAIDELKSDIDNVPTGEGIMKSATITITNPDMSLGAVEQEIVNVSEGGVGKILMVDSVMFHASGFSGSTGNQNITIYHSSETTDLISTSRVFLYTGGIDSVGKFNSVNFNPYNAVQGDNQGLKIRLTSANLDNLTGSLKVTVNYTVFTL